MSIPFPPVADLLDSHALNYRDASLRSVSDLAEQLEALALDLTAISRDADRRLQDRHNAVAVRDAAEQLQSACRAWAEVTA